MHANDEQMPTLPGLQRLALSSERGDKTDKVLAKLAGMAPEQIADVLKASKHAPAVRDVKVLSEFLAKISAA